MKKSDKRKIFTIALALTLTVFCQAQTYRSALDIPLDSLTEGQRAMWMEQAEKIYYSAESPNRDEETYVTVLNKELASTKLTDADKERARFQLRECMKNRVGKKVSDFEFIGLNGKKGSFYKDVLLHKKSRTAGKTASGNSYVLLYFFNPDCHDCERVGSILSNDSTMQTLIRNGQLTIQPVYPDDDLTGWKKVSTGNVITNSLPAVRLASEKEREKFHLPAIPSLYLLDTDGTVLLKDATVDRLLYTFCH